jgi:hypothetical protein
MLSSALPARQCQKLQVFGRPVTGRWVIGNRKPARFEAKSTSPVRALIRHVPTIPQQFPSTYLPFLSDGCLVDLAVFQMNLRFFALTILAACLINIPCTAQESVSDAAIVAAIQKLTSTSDSESPDTQFQVFYKSPVRSTELLIAALKPTSRGEYLTGQHPQAVWIVRALRSLTGLDFRATTTATLSSDETHFLNMNAKHQVRFFGTWMSRDRTWVAPKDAQIAIITQWQEWFSHHGHDHKYVNDTNFDSWYF